MFASPIYQLRRAPLLRVFVPSLEEWLSDASVVECESELKRAGILHMLRPGDAVWDIAVGDEGNTGRMVWDGNFLLVSIFCLCIQVASLELRNAGPGLLLLNFRRPTQVSSLPGFCSFAFP